MPENYPNSKPEIKFVKPVPYHPNISETGGICIVSLNHWKKEWYLIDYLRDIEGLLYNPNFDSWNN